MSRSQRFLTIVFAGISGVFFAQFALHPDVWLLGAAGTIFFILAIIVGD